MKDKKTSYWFHAVISTSLYCCMFRLLELRKIIFSQLTPRAGSILYFALGVAIVISSVQAQPIAMNSFSAQSFTENAKSADNFVDTIGVNVHLNYTDRVYFQQFDNLIKPNLLKLGVRYLRDGVQPDPGVNRDHFFYKRLRDLANSGIKFNLVTDTTTDYSLLDDIYSWTNRAIVSFEGINEPDKDARISNWVAVVRAAQKKLYKTVKG